MAPARSPVGALGGPARRLLLRALRPFTSYQRELDKRLVAEIAQLRRQVGERDQQFREFELRVAAGRAAELAARRTRRSEGELGLWQRVSELERRLSPGGPLLDFERFDTELGGHVVGYRGGADPSVEEESAYLEFERLFRGPEALITDRHRRYLRLLDGHGPVLDLGCGRGELLELLREAQVEASGVDLDPAMVDRCRHKGLDVQQADAVEYLEGVPERSLGVIFASQVIEHLPYSRLVRLLRAATAKLRLDGRLVLETVNPHSPVALKHFWIDPTHQHPLFPEVVLSLCRLSGFGAGYIWHPQGTGDADEDREVQLDYSVVADLTYTETAASFAPRGAVSVSTAVGDLWYPAECKVLTPAVKQTGTWDREDGAAIADALSPGMTVVDVGAHVGYFAILAARCVGAGGRVLAVEPAPENFALLKANVERTDVRHVEIFNAAAWRERGELELRLSRENTGDHRVLSRDGTRQSVRVPAIKLDDLFAPDERVDFVLLDTQGSERAVIEGMAETIARTRPRLQVEFWPEGIREFGDEPEDVVLFYRELGYEIRVLGIKEEFGEDGSELVALAETRPGGFCTLVLTSRSA